MMQVRTEALRLLGGQRLEGAPPGVVVLTPPLRPAQGREEEIFVMVLDLGEDTPSRLYREVREATAQAFWAAAGSVTAALRRAMAAANQVLFRHNLQVTSPQRCYGALSCAALRVGELFLAQAGPACGCALCEGVLERFPQVDLPPLGMGAFVEVRVVYLTVQPGDTLVLASQGLARSVSDDALRRALSLAETVAVADGLEQVAAGADFTALVIRWPEVETSAVPSPPRRRRMVSPSTPPEEAPPTSIPVLAREVLPETPILSSEPGGLPTPPASVAAEEPLVRVWETVPEAEMAIPPWEQPPTPRRPLRLSLVRRLRLGDRLRRVGRWMAAVAVGAGSGLRSFFRRALPGRERRRRLQRERRPPPPENPRVMVGVTLAILAIVALVTLLVWLTYGSAARRQQVLARARQQAAQAQQAASPTEERGYWEAVLATLAGMEADPEGADLVAQAQEAINRLDRVIWVEPTLLRNFDSGISAPRLVAQGLNLFVLDVDHQAVVQLVLDETGEGVAGETAPTILRAGEEWGGQEVADLVDMAWDSPEGEWTTNALVVLDAGGRLWVYDPAWPDHIYPLVLGPAPGEGTPAAMAAFDGRLYLLAPLANQIWKYRPRGGGYPDRPEPYFPTGAPQSLARACDLAIDGNIYVLFEDGHVAKYLEGEPVPFEVGGVPAVAPHFVALAVNVERMDGPVYLADGADERIVILDSGGRFRAQLRAASGAFRGLNALTLDEAGSRLFFLSGGRLYVMPLPSLP